MSASSSGSSENPGVASGGGWPNRTLGQAPGARRGHHHLVGVFVGRSPLFFQGVGARRAVLPGFSRAVGGLAPRFQRGRGGANAGGGDLGGAPSLRCGFAARGATKLAVGLENLWLLPPAPAMFGEGAGGTAEARTLESPGRGVPAVI